MYEKKQGDDTLLEGTKKLFPTDYLKFKEAMIEAAEDDSLPIALQLNDIQKFTLKDFEDAFTEFRLDTGLDISGNFFLCPTCDHLHVMIEVDYPEVDEHTLLQ